MDELTNGAAATEREASVLFDALGECIPWNAYVMNAMMGSAKPTAAQTKCVHERGITTADAKPIALALLQRKPAPKLSAEADSKFREALTRCIPQG